MSDISKLNLGTGGDLDLKDSTAREKLTVVDPTNGSGLIQFGGGPKLAYEWDK